MSTTYRENNHNLPVAEHAHARDTKPFNLRGQWAVSKFKIAVSKMFDFENPEFEGKRRFSFLKIGKVESSRINRSHSFRFVSGQALQLGNVNFALMRALVLAFLFGLLLDAYALSDGEKTAIGSLLLKNPYLSLLSPPWTSDPSLACDEPPFKGISCSKGSEKHITGLYVPVQFILPCTVFSGTLSLLEYCQRMLTLRADIFVLQKTLV